jgi:uncharacterized NAD(P)/FAD-binding protein YdhS
MLRDNYPLFSDIVVLALGHISIAETDALKYVDIMKYYKSPWSDDIYNSIRQSDDVFLIGSGLTTDDVVLSLTSRKHDGKIYSISRRGMIPVVHEIFTPYPSFYSEIEGKNINEIFSVVKKHLRSADNPRAVIDSLRPHTQAIWKSLSKEDKSRFLRHLNPYWNVIRHRMPEINHGKISELEASGKLEFLTGKINAIKEVDEKICVNYFDKKAGVNVDVMVDAIVNCIGPESSYKKIKMPLIQNLLTGGLIENNETGISIKVKDWNVVNSEGKEHYGLLAIGPILKGELFESTAIPEIRTQAEVLSHKILNLIEEIAE